MANWDEDSPELKANLEAVLLALGESAIRREGVSADRIKAWHTRMMKGLELDEPAFVGSFRGEAGVRGVDVRVVECLGSPWRRVATDVSRFVDGVQRALDGLDGLIPPAVIPATPDQLDAVILLAAQAHARWVEIHPFVNGNGRTARMWANWILVRYGLPAFVRLRPRPDLSEYEAASRAALCRGEYEPTVAVFRAMYDRWDDQAG